MTHNPTFSIHENVQDPYVLVLIAMFLILPAICLSRASTMVPALTIQQDFAITSADVHLLLSVNIANMMIVSANQTHVKTMVNIHVSIFNPAKILSFSFDRYL